MSNGVGSDGSGIDGPGGFILLMCAGLAVYVFGPDLYQLLKWIVS